MVKEKVSAKKDAWGRTAFTGATEGVDASTEQSQD